MISKERFSVLRALLETAKTTREAIWALHCAEKEGASFVQVEQLRAMRPKNLFIPSTMPKDEEPQQFPANLGRSDGNYPFQDDLHSRAYDEGYGEGYGSDYRYTPAPPPPTIEEQLKAKLKDSGAVVPLAPLYKDFFDPDPSEKFLRRMVGALKRAGVVGFIAPFSKWSTPKIKVVTFK